MMDAEVFLKRIQKIDELVKNKARDHARWVEIAEGLGSATIGERVQSTRNLHKGPDAIGNYIDIEREIHALEMERREILSVVERLPADSYAVIYDLYVAVKQYKEIAYDRKKSLDWVRYHRKKGIERLQSILDATESHAQPL